MPSLYTPEPTQAPNRDSVATEYTTFGNVEARNDLQALIEIPLMIRALRLGGASRILEVGCGRGIALPVIDERLDPERLVGVDIDPSLLAEAERNCGRAGVRAELVQGDVRALPFDDASFDLVIDFGTCYHVSGGIAGSRQALWEIARVLAPKGRFVHETPIAQHLAHPVRSFGRTLPWADVAALRRIRTGGLWSLRQKR
jgi:ubiquinone/menaquinone biosynthesis C-methylase UbiE